LTSSRQTPDLKELNQRRPDIYPDAYCIFCASEQRSIKEVAVSMAWSKLEKEYKSLLTKEALKNIVFGLSIEEKNRMKRSKPSSSQKSKVKKEAKKYTTHEILAKEKEKFELWTNAVHSWIQK
ncbi:7363_t:CDS:2, partial [Gigaspora rosea]